MPEPPAPTRMAEPLWLQPYPDVMLESIPDRAPGPEARDEMRESMELVFVTALQRLPPRPALRWCCATCSASGSQTWPRCSTQARRPSRVRCSEPEPHSRGVSWEVLTSRSSRRTPRPNAASFTASPDAIEAGDVTGVVEQGRGLRPVGCGVVAVGGRNPVREVHPDRHCGRRHQDRPFVDQRPAPGGRPRGGCRRRRTRRLVIPSGDRLDHGQITANPPHCRRAPSRSTDRQPGRAQCFAPSRRDVPTRQRLRLRRRFPTDFASDVKGWVFGDANRHLITGLRKAS